MSEGSGNFLSRYWRGEDVVDRADKTGKEENGNDVAEGKRRERWKLTAAATSW